MDNCVATITGTEYEPLADVSHPFLLRYAKNVGADFVVLRRKLSTNFMNYERFQVADLLCTYKRVACIDTDCLVKPSCPNLFQLVPEHRIGMLNEAPYNPESLNWLQLAADQSDISFLPKLWNGKYYNTGVMVIGRENRHIMAWPGAEVDVLYEQSIANYRIWEASVPMFDMDYAFNHMPNYEHLAKRHRSEGMIIHYAGMGLVLNRLRAMAVDLSTMTEFRL